MRRCWQLTLSQMLMYEKVTNIYAYQWGTVPRTAFYNPAVKYDPSEKLLHVYKRDNKETLQQIKGSHVT